MPCALSVIIGCFAISSFMGLSYPTWGQTDEPPRQFTVKIGMISSPKGITKYDYFGSSSYASPDKEFTFGASYELTRTSAHPSFLWGPYFDYIVARSHSDNTVTYSGPPMEAYQTKTTTSGFDVGVSGRYRFGHPERAVSPYVGGGLGLYGQHTRVESAFLVAGQTPYNYTETKKPLGLGEKLMLGVDTRSGFLLEINHQFFPGKSSQYGIQADLSGTAFSIGYRF